MAKEKEKKLPDDGAVATVPSQRERYLSRYKEAYPDLNSDDEEAFYGRANEDLDRLDSYRKHGEALVSVFEGNRAFAGMMMAAKDGQDPFEWIAENLGSDLRELLDDPDSVKKVSAAVARFNERQLASAQATKEADANLVSSIETLKSIQNERGLSDDECLQLLSYIYDEVIGNGVKGIVTAETFKMVLDGRRYAADVETARREGEVSGRNAKISEQLRSERGNSGIPPSLGSSVGVKAEGTKRKYKPFLEV